MPISSPSTLLVIDDEPNIAFSLEECLTSTSLRVISATTARAGLEAVRQHRPDVVLLDIRLPDGSGLDVYSQIRAIDARLPVIMNTAYAKTETAIEAMRLGAFDYLVKPVQLAKIKEVLARALEVSRLNRVPAVLPDSEPANEEADSIVGASQPMQEVYEAIGRIASQDSAVLILGESGTGKELVARAIYHYSSRRERPFLAINCAALSETLLESELFGHEKGAFTGADQRRIGKFEQVNGGTIFLDEIGDMSPATQAKALRLLQEQQFERLGGNATVKTDVRVIAATNQDLNQRVADGLFRRDLLYRLNGFTIMLPPLRERLDDLPALIEYFCRKFSRELGKQVATVTPEANELLRKHAWPGNVREFQSAMKYAIVHSTGTAITADCLPRDCHHEEKAREEFSPAETQSWQVWLRELLADNQGDVYRRATAELDRVLVLSALERTQGNQVQAAELLGMSRMTLRSKMRALGLLNDKGSE